MAIEPSFLPEFTQTTTNAIRTSIPTARKGAAQAATATKGLFRRALEKSLLGKALGYGLGKSTHLAGMEVSGAGPSMSGTVEASAEAGTNASGILRNSGESFGSLFAYATSSWAIMCVFMTIVLNRTMLYASLRRPLRPPFRLRLVLRGIPILLLAFHVQALLYSLRCETSPNIPTTQLGSPQFAKTWKRGEQGGFLYWVSRTGTFWESSDAKICVASGMLPADVIFGSQATKNMDPEEIGGMNGSLDLLWPLYTTIAMSHFVETLSCALQGSVPAAETGMTFFEHSLAFAQAEAMSFNSPFVKINVKPHPKNVPPEVLYIALISACGHLTSQLAGLFGRQSRYRLYTTGFWGIATLAGFAWACYGPWADGGDLAVLRLRRFPTVCVVGFIPHLIICTGIVICSGIYFIALGFASLQPPPQPSDEPGQPPVRPRPSLSAGFQNLQATITLQSHAVSMSEDFYTALLKLGLLVLTAASEATYLQEGQPIRVPGLTWLESERLRFLEREKKDKGERAIFEGSFGDYGSSSGEWNSPYSVERKEFSKEMAGLKGRRRGSNSRWRSAGEVIRGTTLVAVRWAVWGFLRVFKPDAIQSESGEGEETDLIRRSRESTATSNDSWEDEASEDDKLYRNFLLGKIDGHDSEENSDTEFVPRNFSRESTVDPYDSDSSTTSHHSHRFRSRSETPTPESYRQANALMRSSPTDAFPTISDPTSFANLLDPKTPEQRHMAKLLAHHLRSDQVVTRSVHRNELRRRQHTLLLGAGERVGKDEEEDVLESIILEARNKNTHFGRGALGMTYAEEEGGTLQGPMCVVCQSSPRTIMVWPCRCLSLCEECRVSLAVNNYATCVCCRGELCGFSRVYVP